MQDQQQRQKYIITSELRLLEKQKTDLFHEIERIEASKKQEYKQYASEIRTLSQRRQELIEQIEKLRDGMALLTESYLKAKEGMETYTKTRQSDVELEVKRLTGNAQRIEKEAITKHDIAEGLIKTYTEKQKQLAFEEQTLNIRNEEYRANIIAMNAKKDAQVKETEQWEHRLNEMEQTKRVLEEELTLLAQKKRETLKVLGELQETTTNELHLAQEKHKKADELLFSLAQREEGLSQREEAVRQEQIALKDRREALERAVLEMRQKGAVIN